MKEYEGFIVEHRYQKTIEILKREEHINNFSQNSSAFFYIQVKTRNLTLKVEFRVYT